MQDLKKLKSWIEDRVDDHWRPMMYRAEGEERYSEAFMWQSMIKSAEIILDEIKQIISNGYVK